jgi:hypothetical protein
MFFWLYATIELLAIFLDSGIIPTANKSYPVRMLLTVAPITLITVHSGSRRSTPASSPPLIPVWSSTGSWGSNSPRTAHPSPSGSVSFPLHFALPPHSLHQFLRITCLGVFGTSFFIAIATFKRFAGFNYTSPTGLWVIYILWPLVCTVVYVVSQLVLVFRTLDDRWPIGDIVFGTAFFTIAQVLLFAFSVTICDAIKHYIDGLFFFTLCMLLSVMMVYKYWDSITVGRWPLFPLLRAADVGPRVLARGSRVFGGIQGVGLGGQGPAVGRQRRAGLLRGGHGEQLSRRAAGQPCWWCERTAAVPEGRVRPAGVPAIVGSVLRVYLVIVLESYIDTRFLFLSS